MNILKYKRKSFADKYKLHDSKAATYWLAFLAFLESSVFLLPVDFLYIPLLLRRPNKAYKYALIATIFSVLGGIAGWMIGAFAYKTIALPILTFYGKESAIEHLKAYHSIKFIVLLLFTSGLVHLPPIKLVNIFAGLLHINIFVFIILNLISRTVRLYGLAWLVCRYGENFMHKGKKFMASVLKVEKRVSILSLLLLAMSIGTILASFFMQYIGGFLPCKLCLIERNIFIAITLLNFVLFRLAFLLKNDFSKYVKYILTTAILTTILTLNNFFLSIYHYGVENGFWKGPDSCTSSNINIAQNTHALLQGLKHIQIVPCDVPSGYFLNISLTLWSVICCFVLLVLLYMLLSFCLHNYKSKKNSFYDKLT